ncbi:MAG TPA: DMT family transporter [Anaerolineales bacterium]
MDRKKAVAFFELTLAVLSWGGSFVATKIALRQVSPVTVIWLRFTMGVVILGLMMFARRQFALPEVKDLGYFALLGFLGITFHQWLQSTGLITAQATTTAWIVATTPVYMALLGFLVLKEGLRNWQVVGIALAVLGVLLVVTNGSLGSLSAGRFGTPGDFLILISAPNWAVFSILSRRGLRQNPSTRMMFYVMAFGWLFTSILLLVGPGIGEVRRLQVDGWLGVGFLGVFCSGLAFIFWYDGLQTLPAAQVGAFLYIEPFVTVIVAAVVLGEPLLLVSLLGGATILVGVWLVNRPAGKPI